MKQLLILAPQPPAMTFMTSLQQVVDEVKYSSQSWQDLSATPLLATVTHLVIDVAGIKEPVDYERTALSLSHPVIFVDFSGQHPVDDIEQSYCWLNWPCELQQLSNKLELSSYKHRFRQQQHQDNELLQRATACIGDILVYLDDQGNVFDCNQTTERCFGVDKKNLVGKPWYYLMRAKRDFSAKQTQQIITAAIKTKAVTRIQPLAVKTDEHSLLLDGIIGPIQYASGQHGATLILRKLATLDSLPTALINASHPPLSSDKQQASSVLLITPDNFKLINHQYGWDTGNLVLNEIESRISKVLRTSDLSSKYSGGSYLVLLHNTQTAQTHNLLNQLMNTLVEQTYLEQDIALTFSFGLALNNEHVGYSPIELFYFANFALSQAIESGGNQCRQWQQQNTLQQIGNFDRVNGNSQGKGTTDYQKMLTFWIILNNLGKFEDKQHFVQTLLKQLVKEFELDNAAFFQSTQNQPELTFAIGKGNQQLSHQQVALSKHQEMYVEQLIDANADATPFTSILEAQGIVVLVPVRLNRTLTGLLRITSNNEQAVALRDHNLLNKIADFVAVTLDNIDREINRPQHQSKKTSLGGNDNFWYASEKMQQLMQEVNMVAPTDATVLITGESGTGKEMLAKSIHQQSKRSDNPFVIFDCGTVVESLIESELFGHAKGAFTGAEKVATGCIEKAEGGTLFLDEVGELPIHVQVKLLRFVQEKQFSPVGSSKYRSADVRVVAATNVDLELHIKKGLFREDLYYRLNVFKIESPPLRQRHADILLLAENYLKKYSDEYGKQIYNLSEEAKQAITEYHWPGNIRELKNLIHRASIICSESTMGCSHIGLYPVGNTAPLESPKEPLISQLPSEVSTSGSAPLPMTLADTHLSEPLNSTKQDMPSAVPPDPVTSAPITPCSPDAAATKVAVMSSSVPDTSAPWTEIVREYCALDALSSTDNCSLKVILEKHLYQASLNNSQQVTLQAADKVNIAESTFRRRWKILRSVHTDWSPSFISKVNSLVERLLATESTESRTALIQQELARSCQHIGLSAKDGASLLDIKPPTYRSLLKKLRMTSESQQGRTNTIYRP